MKYIVNVFYSINKQTAHFNAMAKCVVRQRPDSFFCSNLTFMCCLVCYMYFGSASASICRQLELDMPSMCGFVACVLRVHNAFFLRNVQNGKRTTWSKLTTTTKNKKKRSRWRFFFVWFFLAHGVWIERHVRV